MMRPPAQVRPLQRKLPPSRYPRKEPPPRPRQTPRNERLRPPSTRSSESQDGSAAGSIERPVAPLERRDEAKDERVTVCVRVRPMSTSEVSDGFSQVVHCDLDIPGAIQISRPQGDRRKFESYTFDTVLPSSAGQAAVYNLIGSPVFDRMAEGYNSCIIAFGATGCGKSHTIFGHPNQERGLLPRIAENLFQSTYVDSQTLVKLSYLELYNEKARDLLQPEGVSKASLEVREHPKAGVFVEGLTRSVVSSTEDVLRLVDFGHKIRVVGSTHMNAQSSRSHAIVTLHLQQVHDRNGSTGQVTRHSQLHAVDLAGAERLFMAGEDALRRRESMQINKSLLALGQMISRLSKGMAGSHVPYRNSKLTFLLVDSLMGNCQTAMIACISPSSSYQQLTDSTLRFATSVKAIKTKPVQNEEVQGDLVQSLRAEVAMPMLRRRLRQGGYDQSQAMEMEAQLRGDEYLQEELGCSYAEVQARAKSAEGLRRRTLRQLGLRQTSAGCLTLHKISLDPLLSGRLTWSMSPGDELRIGSDPDCEILVEGLGVEAEMCRLRCLDSQQIQVLPAEEVDEDALHRKGSLFKRGSGIIMVNSQVLKEPNVMQSGDFLRVGRTHFFRVLLPDEAPGAEQQVERFLGTSITKEAEQLRQRLGTERADEVIRDLRDLKLVVEEANELTLELRGLVDLSFKGRLLMDPLDSKEEPAVVVSLRKQREEKAGAFSDERSQLIATWTLADFQHRLEVMRDIYDEVRQRDLPWGQPGDLDPWQARDNIPVITAMRDTPQSSYAGSPTKLSRENTPRAGAIPYLDTSLAATLNMPCRLQQDQSDKESFTGVAPESLQARLLQQLPLLQAELAKAHEAQGQQATELSSVRRELQELRQSMNRKKETTSPARRASDAGLQPQGLPLEGHPASLLMQQAMQYVVPRQVSPNRTSARWQGAARPEVRPEPRAESPSSQALGSPQSQKDMAFSNVSGISSVPAASEDRSTQLSHVSFKMDGITCYAPARSLAESVGPAPVTAQPSNGAILRQFSAPVGLRSPALARQSTSGAQIRPMSTVLPAQPVTLSAAATPPAACGWPAPNPGSVVVGAATPRPPQIAPVRYVPTTPRQVPLVAQVLPRSLSPDPEVARSTEGFAQERARARVASAPTTPRYRRSEPVTPESLQAMAAAAKAAAQVAPGMNIVVRPVSPAQVAMLSMRQPQPMTPRAEEVAMSRAQGDELRSCQMELAGLRKEVDALGQVCRGLTRFETPRGLP